MFRVGDNELINILFTVYTANFRKGSNKYTLFGKMRNPFLTFPLSICIIVLNMHRMVSNCQTNSDRESYVDDLHNFVDVDVFGNCGKLKCVRKNDYDPGQL